LIDRPTPLHRRPSNRLSSGPLGLLLALGLAAAQTAPARPTVTQALLANEASGRDWPGVGRTFSSQHHSPLTQIDAGNVTSLKLAAALDLPDVWNVSSMPLEVNGVLYFAVGYSVVHAVDATSGKLLWRYDTKVTGAKMRFAWGIRGLALWHDLVITGTQDGRLVAVHAKTGKLAWQTQTTEPGDIRYITGAPLVFNGLVLIGHGGADFGPTRGYVTAYDAKTGQQRWRFYTVPGNPADGFENEAMAMAAKTWTGEWWKHGGGGTVWNAMTYDPVYNRVYLGTGNGSPWNRKIRSPGGGDNLFLCSIVALDADTGRYVWHYQVNPGETWDFNAAMDITLATLKIDHKERNVILHAPKNGFFYVIDRDNGQLISADKFAKVTWAERVDLATGRPVEAPNARYQSGETLIWPGSLGAHSWPPMSFNPGTGLVYIPTRDVPGYYNDTGIDPKTWQAGQTDTLGLNPNGADVPASVGQGYLLAWDPLRQRQVWRVDTPGITAGGTLTTAGGLVFQPRADGQLVAYNARDGRALWQFNMGVGSQAPAITYEVKGRQYVALLAGWAGQAMMLGSSSAAHGWVGRGHPRRLLIFSLNGRAHFPAAAPPAQPRPIDDAQIQLDPARVQRGGQVYMRCVTCHGLEAVAGGFAPDLRASPLGSSTDALDAVVRGGALENRGMPAFPELSASDILDLQHFLRGKAREALVAP
jgi:quinohemoprotein ethanol dehydrogenase